MNSVNKRKTKHFGIYLAFSGSILNTVEIPEAIYLLGPTYH